MGEEPVGLCEPQLASSWAAAAVFLTMTCFESVHAQSALPSDEARPRAISSAAATPMPLISIGQPIHTSSAQYPASNANDGNYNNNWRSYGVPANLSLDLSSVPAAERDAIWLVWYNDG